MIVDFHTHVFPPAVIEEREALCRRDPLFRSLYANRKAKIATAPQLLESLDKAGVDMAVVLGFAWSTMADCTRHNDYLLDVASREQRLIPFCTVQPRDSAAAIAEIARCAAAGARGLGELRPDDQGFNLLDSDASTVLAESAKRHELVLLFHVSEPVGHDYPGKGGLAMADFSRFAAANSDLRIVGAHWGGGLPFYSLMPEIKVALASTWFDTAASGLLYGRAIYTLGAKLAGPEKILFGSDFPLIGPLKARREIERAGLDRAAEAAVLGGNAARLLGLE